MTGTERNELLAALGRVDHFRRDTAMLFLSLDRLTQIKINLQRDIARSYEAEVKHE